MGGDRTGGAPAPAGPSGAVAAPTSGSGDRAVALLLAAAAVLAALLAARATFLAGEASGAWQQALRMEVKRGAATAEDVRFVYGSEARIAYQVVQARVREEEYRAEAERQTATARELLLFEADVHRQVGEALLPASEVAADERYALPDGGVDIVARLADVRARNADLVALDPDREQARGDAASRRAVLTVAAGIPVGITFLFGALAQAMRHARRPLLIVGAITLGIGLVAGAFSQLVTIVQVVG